MLRTARGAQESTGRHRRHLPSTHRRVVVVWTLPKMPLAWYILFRVLSRILLQFAVYNPDFCSTLASILQYFVVLLVDRPVLLVKSTTERYCTNNNIDLTPGPRILAQVPPGDAQPSTPIRVTPYCNQPTVLCGGIGVVTLLLTFRLTTASKPARRDSPPSQRVARETTG